MSTGEDTPVAVNLTGSDADGDALTFQVTSGPSHGSLSGAAPNLTYAPAPDYNGPDSFQFTVTDGLLTSPAAIVSIDVAAVNDAPAANPQSIVTVQDTPVGITLSGSDVDGTPLTFRVTGGPSFGSLSGAAPNLVYTPNAGYNGPDSFTFVANDGQVDSAAATVSITVKLAGAVNEPPTANAQAVTTDEDVSAAITLTGADPNSDTLSYRVTSGPSHGSLSGAAPNLTYTPEANYNGPDVFEFVANDGQVDSVPAAVAITVTPVNDAPAAGAQSLTTSEDTSVPLTLSGSDVDGDVLTYRVTSGPNHGALSGTAPNLSYIPAANYNGPDAFQFVVNDGQVDSAAATVDVAVDAVNDPPVANAQPVTTLAGTPVAVTLTGSDIDGDPLSYVVTISPGHGVLSGAAPNLTYTPTAGYIGPDSFAFVVNDGTVDSAAATVSLTVNPNGPNLYVSSTGSGTAGNVSFADEDILIRNQATGGYSLYFDGSDVGLSSTDVDAYEMLTDGSLLFSFDSDFTLSGFGTVDDSDVLKFTPTSTGDNTAGTWSWYFDGSDVGLTTTGEDVDALALLPDGRLIISTLDAVSVTGVSGADEDLLAFTPSALGSTTSGTWAMYFDGSDVGLSTSANEDINAVDIDPTGKIYISTVGSFSVTGASGDGSDVIVCTPSSLGSTTACTWAVYWDGSANGFSGQDTDALFIVP